MNPLKAVFGGRQSAATIRPGPSPDTESMLTSDARWRAAEPPSEPREATPIAALEHAHDEQAAVWAIAEERTAACEAALIDARNSAATATKRTDSAREAFKAGRAAHTLDGAPLPSRDALTSCEASQRDLEDLIEALEQRRGALAVELRDARRTEREAFRVLARAWAAMKQAEFNEFRLRREALDVEERRVADDLREVLAACERAERELEALARQTVPRPGPGDTDHA